MDRASFLRLTLGAAAAVASLPLALAARAKPPTNTKMLSWTASTGDSGLTEGATYSYRLYIGDEGPQLWRDGERIQ